MTKKEIKQAGTDRTRQCMEVKKGDLSFEVHDDKIVTNKADEAIFEAMLTTFVKTYPGVKGPITTDSPANEAMWKKVVSKLEAAGVLKSDDFAISVVAPKPLAPTVDPIASPSPTR